MDTKKLFKHIPWVILGIIGAFCLSVVALRRGEHVSALWIVVASVSVYLVAYRYYSLYIAQKVMKLDPTRSTPAVINNDGLNYVPTNRYVLFGHHFAAIAGAGPLVGPVLAAQMGYLPGTLWLLAGVVLAGAVQDFMVLFVSTRRPPRLKRTDTAKTIPTPTPTRAVADPAAVPDPMDTTSGLGRLVQELDAAVSAEARKTAEAAAADAPAEQGDKGKAENGKPAAKPQRSAKQKR